MRGLKENRPVVARARISAARRQINATDGHPCPHYPRCVGCPFIAVPYAEQLTRKREIVARSLAGYPSLAGLEAPAVLAAPHRLGYRTRIKLVVRATSGDIAAGLYVPGTHRVIDISSCAVHPRPVNQVVQYLKKKCLELKIMPYDERVDEGELRYLDLRYSFLCREVSVTLVTRHREFPKGGPLARALMRKFSWVNGVIQNINEQRGNVIWGDRNRILAGRDTLLEKIGPLTLAYPAGVFSQANPATAQILYESVAEMAALTGQDSALDLYCGVGPISLTLADRARLVWGIDDSTLSIDTAKQNARRNGVGNCRFFDGDVALKARRSEKFPRAHRLRRCQSAAQGSSAGGARRALRTASAAHSLCVLRTGESCPRPRSITASRLPREPPAVLRYVSANRSGGNGSVVGKITRQVTRFKVQCSKFKVGEGL